VLFGSAEGKGMTMELIHAATYCRVMNNNVTCLVAAFAGVMELLQITGSVIYLLNQTRSNAN
jgi:hypothetical protein